MLGIIFFYLTNRLCILYGIYGDIVVNSWLSETLDICSKSIFIFLFLVFWVFWWYLIAYVYLFLLFIKIVRFFLITLKNLITQYVVGTFCWFIIIIFFGLIILSSFFKYLIDQAFAGTFYLITIVIFFGLTLLFFFFKYLITQSFLAAFYWFIIATFYGPILLFSFFATLLTFFKVLTLTFFYLIWTIKAPQLSLRPLKKMPLK